MRRYWHVLLLAGWAVACFLRFAPHGGYSWHYFSAGSAALFGGGPAGGLRLYADHPQLQIGPLAFAAAEGLRLLGPHAGVVAAEVAATLLGLYVLQETVRVALLIRPGLAARPAALRATVLVGGGVFLVGWTELAVAFTHLDDALALALSLAAVRAALRGRPVLVGVLIGLATDAKPWALVFLPLALALPARTWWRAAAGAAVTVASAWLPFVLGDSQTTAAMQYTIRTMPGSALRVLGVRAPRTPWWDRSAQLLLGWALAAASVARGRWPAVILLGVGARIALDPADHGYYTAGILLGALLWDLTGTRRPVPAWTVLSFAALTAVHSLTHDSAVLGALRLGLVVAFSAVILAGPPWRGTVPEDAEPGPVPTGPGDRLPCPTCR